MLVMYSKEGCTSIKRAIDLNVTVKGLF